jgi:branched-chain amino acid transport system permease protein
MRDAWPQALVDLPADALVDAQIALLLVQDGVTNGAIYALMALALVLIFAVTRIIFIPLGEFVAYGALTLAGLQSGTVPLTLALLAVLAALAALLDSIAAMRAGRAGAIARIVGLHALMPVLAAVAVRTLAVDKLPLALQILLTMMIVVPLGPLVYRLAFQRVAEASVLFLLIVAVAVHLVLLGLGLFFFGAEGSRTPAFTDGSLSLGSASIQFQALWIVGIALALIVALALFFERTIYGKALRATALNRVGARLMGIPTELAGRITFALAALIGAFSGVLISPITTIYYDTGFLVGLKGFVGAIIGALASYPLAALGALLVGLLESFSSFYASAFKEVIVFTAIIPVLLWRSVRARAGADEES